MEKNMDTNFDFNKTGKFDFGLRKVIWTAAIAVAASVAVLLVLNIDFSASSSQPSQVNNGIQEVDKAFAQLSSADQDYLLSVYQEDVFLNN